MSHGGGSKKCAKSVKYYLNGPLNLIGPWQLKEHTLNRPLIVSNKLKLRHLKILNKYCRFYFN